MESIISGEKVRLKDDVLPYLGIREWEFQKAEGGIVLLTQPQIKCTLRVKENNIEWDKNQGLKKGTP